MLWMTKLSKFVSVLSWKKVTVLIVALMVEAQLYVGDDHLLTSSNIVSGPLSTRFGTPLTKLQVTKVLFSMTRVLGIVPWHISPETKSQPQNRQRCQEKTTVGMGR